MRYFRWIIAVLAVIVTLLRIVFFIAKSDIDVGPTITCEKDYFEVKCDDDLNDLIKYVSATDPQDGKISDITIERMYFVNDNKSKISFVAIDSDNNIARISRKVIYTDYEGPKIHMLDPLVYSVTDNDKIEKIFSADDQFSGDISDRIKLIINSFSRRQAGVYPLTVKVSNFYGTTRSIDFNAYVFNSPFTIIELNENVVYLSKDQSKPDFLSYMKNPSENITVDEGDLDMGTEGSYEVLYYAGDKNSPTAFNRLVVVVGD